MKTEYKFKEVYTFLLKFYQILDLLVDQEFKDASLIQYEKFLQENRNIKEGES